MARRRKRGGDGGPPVGAPAWMMTYGDLVTQLLAFFVLLYTFSSINEQKFRETIISLQGAFGILPGSHAISGGPQPTQSPNVRPSPVLQPNFRQPEPDRALPRDEQLAAIYRKVKATVEELEQSGHAPYVPQVEVELDEQARRVIIRYRDQALFDSGRAEIKPEARPRLDSLALILKEVPNSIRVEGHTDNVPIHNSRFPSNWELSGARAMSVVRYLIDQHQFPPPRLDGTGKGEWWPIADNATVEGRARNRRVDIIILALDEEQK